MNYRKIYDALIDRARNRILNGYAEKHHIIPRCMGGSDDIENLVRLTPEEHFLVHQLLIKIYPEHQGLLFAARIMTVGRHKKNKLYAWMRRRIIESQLGKKLSEETKSRISNSHVGKKQSLKTVAKRAKALTAGNYSPTFVCEICLTKFSDRKGLNKHLLRLHSIDRRRWIRQKNLSER